MNLFCMNPCHPSSRFDVTITPIIITPIFSTQVGWRRIISYPMHKPEEPKTIASEASFRRTQIATNA